MDSVICRPSRAAAMSVLDDPAPASPVRTCDACGRPRRTGGGGGRVGRLAIAALTLALGGTERVSGLTIDLDFAHENALFLDPVARAAVEAAASDLSGAITSSLNVITTDVWQGSFQSTTATLDFNYQYENPTLGGVVSINPATAGSDRVRVYVGSRPISVSNTLGQGGPAGIGVNLQVTGLPSQAPTAIANASSKATTAYLRGGGPVIGVVEGSGNFSGVPFAYAVSFGAAYGQLWFDTDGNNDGVNDSPTDLANYWHYDHATPVASGKQDLYSVAIHELMHVLGFGTSLTWNSLQQGSAWTGTEAAALAGGGANLLQGPHIVSGKMSTRVSDNAPQEAAMDPSLTRGARKQLTWLDVAFLRDLGWQTIAPTLPGDFNGDGRVDGADLTVWSLAFGATAAADSNGDGDSDGLDLLAWQRGFQGGATAAPAIAAVPEPHAAWLALATAAWHAASRGGRRGVSRTRGPAASSRRLA